MAQRRRFVELLRLAEFGLERGHQPRDIELEESAVSPDKPADIDRRGEGGIIAFIERAVRGRS